jgi:hypothetical protein
MTDTLAVSVVLVALAVAVMSVVRLVVLRRMARAAGVVVAIGRFSDPGLRGRGDPAAARTLGGSDPREGRGSRRACRGSRRGPAGWRRLARACRGRLPRGARWRRRPRRSGSDDRRDVAGSGRWSGDCGLVAGQIEKPRRGQDEADGCQYGEHAGQWCGYARKTTPHKCPIGAPAPVLNLNGGIRTSRPLRETSRPLRENFLQHEGVRGCLGDPSIPLGMAVSGRAGAAVVVEHHISLLGVRGELAHHGDELAELLL